MVVHVVSFLLFSVGTHGVDGDPTCDAPLCDGGSSQIRSLEVCYKRSNFARRFHFVKKGCRMIRCCTLLQATKYR